MSAMDILHKDCLSLLRDLEAGSVPLIIADPPYGIGYHSNHYKDKNPHTPVANDWNFHIGDFLAACGEALTEDGALYLFCRWDVSPLWVPHIKPARLKLKTIIAWVKDNWSAGDLKGSYGNQYEQIIFASKGRHLLRGKRYPNVWPFPRVPSTKMLHPTQKPVALLRRIIESSSDEGDLVADPFSGSGSTGKACLRTNRKYLLGDIDPKMVNLSKRRLGLPYEADAPVESLPVYTPEQLAGLPSDELQVIADLLNKNIRGVAQR